MPVKANINFIWSGANAAIPAGWTRNTDFDDKFIKGTADGVDPDVADGATTHVHTVTGTHTHTAVGHTHTYTTSAGSGSTLDSADSSGAGIIETHTHTGTTNASSGGNLTSVTPSYGAVSNNPPYHTVIYCKSDGTNNIGDDMIGFADDNDVPTGWKYCDGNNSTPNLVNKYLLGASVGADSGGTGGSTANTHTITHGTAHTADAHSHSSSTVGASSGTRKKSDGGSGAVSVYTHTHALTVTNATASISAATPSVAMDETVEPAYTKLMAVQNQTGADDLPTNMIGMWVGTLATIPSGWSLCNGSGATTDMRGRYLKSSATVGEVGDTGGSNTHTHAAKDHTHTGASHTHTLSVNGHTNATTRANPGPTNTDSTTTHAGFTSGGTTETYNTGSTAGNSSSNEPEYRTVAFIKYAGVGVGGAFLLNML